MQNSAKDFHVLRRIFIMMPDGRFLLGPENIDITHEQMLMNAGVASKDVQMLLVTVPRGYFMNHEICIYQGFDMTPGTIWKLSPDNYGVVRRFIPRLCQEFALNEESCVWTGVRVGVVGKV